METACQKSERWTGHASAGTGYLKVPREVWFTKHGERPGTGVLEERLVFRVLHRYHSTKLCASAHVARKCQGLQRQGQDMAVGIAGKLIEGPRHVISSGRTLHQIARRRDGRSALAVDLGQRFSSRIVLVSPEADWPPAQTGRHHTGRCALKCFATVST